MVNMQQTKKESEVIKKTNPKSWLRITAVSAALTFGVIGITSCAPSELGHQATSTIQTTIPIQRVYTGSIKTIKQLQIPSKGNNNGYGQIVMDTDNLGKYVIGGPGGGLKNSIAEKSNKLEAELIAKSASEGKKISGYVVFAGKNTPRNPKIVSGDEIVVKLDTGGTITVIEIRSYATGFTQDERVKVITTNDGRARIESTLPQ